MENANAVLENEHQEQSELKLKLSYMVEDFFELIKKNEREEAVSSEK